MMSPRLIAVAFCLVASARPLTAQARAEDKEDVKAREEYFWQQRSYPSTERPYLQMERARSAVISHSQGLFDIALSFGVPGGWRSLGPDGLLDADNGFFSSTQMLDIGRVTAIVPTGTGSLYIGTASGGVWQSTSGGYWNPLTDTQCNLTIGAVAIDAADPNVLFAATGEYNTGSWGCGILRSLDGGASWTQLGATSFRVTNGGAPDGSAGFAKLFLIRPSRGSIANTVVLGASTVGVYRSPDGGITWNSALDGATASLVALPIANGALFAGNSDNFTPSHRGVYRSTDNGATWTPLPAMPGISTNDIDRTELAVTPAAPNLVYVAVSSRNATLLGFFLWDDAAGTWTRLFPSGLYNGSSRGDFGDQAWYDLAMAVDPRDASRVYLAGVRGFRSTDGGQTFRPMGMDIHVDWHSIVIDPVNPDILYAGTDGGVFTSSDRGDTWASLNAGLTLTQYYPGISAAPNGSRIAGGSQDNGTHIYTGSMYWNSVTGGDGGYTAINYDNPQIIYSSTAWFAGPSITRYDGTSFSERSAGIQRGDRAEFIPPYVMDPVTSTTLYFGTHRLYKTTNEGTLWAPISQDLTKGSGDITTIAVSKLDPRTIYVGASDGMVNVSRNGGTTFTPSTTGLPNRYITHITIDPSDAAHALLTVSGFGTGHVFETKDAGVHWTDISSGLVDAPANAIVFVPGLGIMVGTDVGVFQAPSPGAGWIAGPAGIPNVIVYDLIYVPAAKMLVAGTYGRGMFAYTVGGDTPVLRGDVNADGQVDAFDALLIQQSLVGTLPAETPIYPRGDADCNLAVQTADVVYVLRAAVGIASPGVCVNTVH